jgi:hypothetical protein
MKKLTIKQLEQKRIDNKKYYEKNKESINKKTHEYYFKNKDKRKDKRIKYSKEYCIKNKDKMNLYAREHQREIRIKVIEMMGGKCVKCGFEDIRALQIDHIDGGGYKERKEASSKNFNRRVIKSLETGEIKFQLLCANCNWIKRHENNETRINN